MNALPPTGDAHGADSAAAPIEHSTSDSNAIPQNWHRRVLTLAFPIVLANLTQPLLGAVDTAVAGHLGTTQALGGVAVGGLFFSCVFWAFGFLRMGTTGLVAQSFGARDHEGVRANLMRAMILAIAIGALILALQWPLMHYGIGLIGASPTVRENALVYVQARMWAAPLVLLNYVVLGYLLGRQQVRMALLTQIFINAINMIAVWVYVYGFGWGVEGIGAATASADACGLLLGLGILWRLRAPHLPRIAWRTLIEPTALRRLVSINRDILIRTLCLLGSTGWFAHVGARQGDVILAANALLLNFQTFMSYGLDGFAHAAEALVGSAIGARHRSAFRQAVQITLLWSAIGALLLCLIFALSGSWIIARLTDQIAIQQAAAIYLPWVIILPLASVLGFQLDGVFIGATRTHALMIAMMAALLIFMLAAWILVPMWGNHGLWLAFTLFMLARGIVLALLLPRLSHSIAR